MEEYPKKEFNIGEEYFNSYQKALGEHLDYLHADNNLRGELTYTNLKDGFMVSIADRKKAILRGATAEKLNAEHSRIEKKAMEVWEGK